jgi:Glycosyl-4,4'-diaponeurosporenoate acyltransferase
LVFEATLMRSLGERGVLEVWFGPKRFETERLYERLGARPLKRYIPTGGDLMLRTVRRRYPGFSLVGARDIASLRRLERGTRVAEAMHAVTFIGFSALAVRRFKNGSLTSQGLGLALVTSAALGLWPIVLQRYNRLRLYRAIEIASRRG